MLKEERRRAIDMRAPAHAPRKRRGSLSYVLFANQHRKGVIAQQPNLTFSEVSKALSVAWRALSGEQRAEWKSKADADY